MSDWIPISERLPRVDQRVAILIADEDVAIRHFPTCARFSYDFRGTENERIVWWAGVPGKWMNLWDSGWTVTHWCELPTPPADAEESV